MSLYNMINNMINGVNQATIFFLPMLGKHPDKYPRFRDCFIGVLKNDEKEVDQFGIPEKNNKIDKNKRQISVYTRVGGGNREEYTEAISELRKMTGYITDYDDDFDSTYATFVFDIPKKWHKDYDRTIEGKPISKEYKNQIIKVFPKLKEKLKDLAVIKG